MVEVGDRVVAIWGAYYPEQEGTISKIVDEFATVEFDGDFDPEAGVPNGVYGVDTIRQHPSFFVPGKKLSGSPIGVWILPKGE